MFKQAKDTLLGAEDSLGSVGRAAVRLKQRLREDKRFLRWRCPFEQCLCSLPPHRCSRAALCEATERTVGGDPSSPNQGQESIRSKVGADYLAATTAEKSQARPCFQAGNGCPIDK